MSTLSKVTCTHLPALHPGVRAGVRATRATPSGAIARECTCTYGTKFKAILTTSNAAIAIGAVPLNPD